MADFARHSPRGLLMTHERFAGDPGTAARPAYAFFGWPFDDSIPAFLRSTTSGGKNLPGASAVGNASAASTVTQGRRQPVAQGPRRQQVGDIRSIISGGALLALWPELSA